MAYQVFARKWRPQLFEDVVGQRHITDTLKRAIEKDRVAHAYIFSGTRGVGKTTTARILAKALNCQQGPTPNPCGQCESCVSVTSGNSFDVVELDGASNNSVDAVRELIGNIGYTSMSGQYRVIIIDEVHMLTNAAFNALLKPLEEPPEKVIFILATTEPEKIIDTVKSRCQRFDFRPISNEDIYGQLAKICTNENIAYDEMSLRLIAARANTSMRDSLSLLDQVYSFCDSNLQEKEVRSVLGLVDTALFHQFMKAIKEGETAQLLELFSASLRQGTAVEEVLTGFLEYLRTLLFLAIPGGVSTLSADNEDAYRTIAAQFSESDLLRFCELCATAESELRFSTIPRFVIERLLVKLALMERTLTMEQIIALAQGTPLSQLVVPQKSPATTPTSASNRPNSSVHHSQETNHAPTPPSVSAPVVAMHHEEVSTPVPNPAPVPSSTSVATQSPTPQAPTSAATPIQENQQTPSSHSAVAPNTPSPQQSRAPQPHVPTHVQEVPETGITSETTIHTPPLPPAPTPTPTPAEGRDIITQWDQFIKELESRRTMLAAQLSMGKPSIDGTTFTLALDQSRAFVQEQLSFESSTIEKELLAFTATPLIFKANCSIVVAEVPKKIEEKVEVAPVEEIITPLSFEEDLENEPIIQNVLDTFNGKVL